MKHCLLFILAIFLSVEMNASDESLPSKTYVVQDVRGYNSWPMIQALGGKLVCAYSRGNAHDVWEDARAVYARTSIDGGKTWSEETIVTNTLGYGECAIGKGLDANGNMFLWVRRMGKQSCHVLYKTTDGVLFDSIASLRPDPMPIQITDVFSVPKVGLMALWFAGSYKEGYDHSWGTLTSSDNGHSWTQHVVEKGLSYDEWPTEPSAVYLGKGKIVAVARTESGTSNLERAQFQLISKDYGKTWERLKTNINDVFCSTPSLVYDKKSGLISVYYYYRGKGLLLRRIAKPSQVIKNPKAWSVSQLIAKGSTSTFDAGNVNVTSSDGKHYISFYSGCYPNTSILVTVTNAPLAHERIH